MGLEARTLRFLRSTGIGDDIHLAISRTGDEVNLGYEPSRPVGSPQKTTLASVQCRFSTSSVSSP